MKKLLILLISVLFALSLTCCTGDGGDTDDGGHDDISPVAGEKLVWDSSVDLYLISPLTGAYKTEFVDEFSRGTGGIALIGLTDNKEKREHEIVIGESNREVSRLAYEALLSAMPDDVDDAEGYLVYAYDGSIAIAYSSEAALKPSVNAFLKNCLGYEMKLLDGVVISDFYSLRERADENREKMYKEHLLAAEKRLSESGVANASEICAAIKKLYTLYDADMLEWLVSLYDKDGGGFYYSKSGRDNLGYLPDLESTGQALQMLDRSGLFDDFGGLKSHGVPEAMHASMSAWLLSLQSSEDGFFYHPQWGSAIASSRRSRDLDNARALLRYLKIQPYYDEPGGQIDGTLGAPGQNAPKPAAYITMPLGTDADLSLVSSDRTSLPVYLQSLDAWRTYLNGHLNADKTALRDSYSSGNTFVSDWSLIMAAGEEYVDCIIDFLNEYQIPETGLWEYNTPDNDYDPTDGIGFNGTNGLMKISVLYGSLNRSLPNAYNALQSAIKVGLYTNTPEKNETVCYVLNIWTCIHATLSNVKANDPQNYPAARALVMQNAPALIESSYEILKPHLMADGGFCYFEESPMNISQGALVGCAEWLESDINATMVASSSTVGALFGALGISGMPIWCADDYYIFMDAYEKQGSIVKNPKAGVETFEDYTGESPVKVGEDYEIVTDSSSLNGGRVLSLSESAEITVDIKNRFKNCTNQCYFLESDFLVTDAQIGTVMRFAHTSSDGAEILAVVLECYEEAGEKYLRLVEAYEGLDGVKSVIKSGISLGEWHRIRLVSNKVSRTVNGEKIRDIYTKVSLDDRFIMKIDSAFTEGGAVTDEQLYYSKINLYTESGATVYFDNILSEKKDLPYT